MANQKMGQFISQLRKSKQMTQKDLAAKLNITDKAVSKWERGISCPDISLLPTIAEILDVTTSELLNGEKSEYSSVDVKVSIDNALTYADKTARSRVKTIQNIFAVSFTVLIWIGILVCVICDMAINGTLTWAWFPISSSIFAWLVFFPTIKFGTRGILCSLIFCSVFVIPYLYVLSQLVKSSSLIMPVGVRAAVISIVYLWCVFALFKILKERKLLAGAVSLLLTIPVYILINFSLSKIIAEPLVDIWDILAYSVIAALALVLFLRDHAARKNQA